MRIVFFSHYFPPEGNAPANRTYDHCVRWAAAGHHVTVITCAPNVPSGVVYPGYKNRVWPTRENVDGVNVIRTWTYVAPNAGGLKRILNYVSYLFSSLLSYLFFCRRGQVVIATSPQFFCGWAGVIASWMKWSRFILEIRDIWPESIVTVGAMKKGLGIRLLELMERVMYRSADCIVTVGNGYKANIVSKIGRENRIKVITNGVDPREFAPRPADEAFLEKHGLQGKFVCTYAGTIGMAHGLEIAVRAAKRLQDSGRNDIVFLLVGDGARREALQNLANESGVESLVRFSGRLDKSMMPVVLASSDCLLVHLKRSELFETVIPSKIFEAMAMQRPIVMGVRGESAEIVRNAGAGVEIEPDNAEDLTNAVIRLCDNREFYASLGKNSRDFVLQHFTRDSLAASFLSLIEKRR
jgi:glycosyltransferase involved in cell wall biosynthesis